MVNEMHESIDYSFHWRKKAFLFQDVVKCASADVRSGHVRTDGIEPDVLLREILAVRTNEPYRTTEQESAFLLLTALPISRIVFLLLRSRVNWECYSSVSNV